MPKRRQTMVSGHENEDLVSFRPVNVAPPDKFDWRNPNWETWMKRWERYRVVSKLNETPEEYQVNNLIYALGNEAEELLERNHLSPEEMRDYDKVIDCLSTYFRGRVNTVFERTKFFSRNQLKGEPVEQFIKDLHRIAVNCKFDHLKD